MRFYLFIFFIFTFNLFAETPNWIENPGDDCYAGYICKVGTGDTPGKAISDAKNSITAMVDPSTDSINKINTPEIEEFLNSIYKEISTNKTYSANLHHFSFALISIDTLKDKMKTFIDNIDNEINELNKNIDDDSKLKIKNLNIIKNNLNSKLDSLSSNSTSERMPAY